MGPDGTVSVLAATAAVDALENRGIDFEPDWEAAKLSKKALASIESRLPHGDIRRLWEAAAVEAQRCGGEHK
jgi:hypothetical protein